MRSCGGDLSAVSSAAGSLRAGRAASQAPKCLPEHGRLFRRGRQPSARWQGLLRGLTIDVHTILLRNCTFNTFFHSLPPTFHCAFHNGWVTS